MSRKFLILFVLLIFIVGFLASREAIQERGVKPVVEKKKEENKNQKIALVIGNASYKESPLKNPANDANDIAEVLKKCGFEVALKTNTNQLDMEKAVREFSDNLKDGGIGLFYFSGHGVQVEGINYLIPVNSNIQDEIDVKAKSVSANYILGKMDRRKDGMNIIILDACRINPYARSFRSPSTGLAQMDAPQGSLIVYATSPGKTADDGTGRNGIFTKHLLEMIKETPFEIMVLLRKVRKSVMAETNNKQIPWESSSLLGSFYFSYTDTQLEKTKTEISELESQIKSHEVQRQEFEKIKSEKEEREAARQEEEKKAQLKLKELEEERLLKEKERQEELIQEERRLSQEEAQKKMERARQNAAEKERLRQLRQKLAEEEEKLKNIIKQEVMSVDMASKEVQLLETKINDFVALVSDERGQSLNRLETDYKPLKERLKKEMPVKDLFETTKDYNIRLSKHQEKVRALEEKYKSEYRVIQRKYDDEIASFTEIYKDRIEELKNKKYKTDELKIKLSRYNADNEIYLVDLSDKKGNTWYYSLSIKPDKARDLHERKELLDVSARFTNLNDTNSFIQAYIIDPVLGELELFSAVRLRSDYIIISKDDARSMIKQRGFFDKELNKSGDFRNQFELKDINGDKVVIDYAANLTWHQSGSLWYMTFKEAKYWVVNLNKKGYAGHHDWRLPTLEESVSLLESTKNNNDLYIETVFSDKQKYIWTADKESSNSIWVWVVNFRFGNVKYVFCWDNIYVRPVRSTRRAASHKER